MAGLILALGLLVAGTASAQEMPDPLAQCTAQLAIERATTEGYAARLVYPDDRTTEGIQCASVVWSDSGTSIAGTDCVRVPFVPLSEAGFGVTLTIGAVLLLWRWRSGQT